MTDLSFSDYTARQFHEVEAEQLHRRAQAVEPSGHYRLNGHGWEPQPYPGFAVVSMVAEEPANGQLPGVLEAVQAALWEHCPWRESLYFLPASSFHQTVANTLSEEKYVENIARPGLEGLYPRRVGEAFARIEAARAAAGAPRTDRPGHGAALGPLPMQLIGLSIFGTALGVLGIFEKEESYQRVLRFREAFYGDAAVRAFGVKRTRPFIGHVTLAYIETALTAVQREELAAAAYGINQTMFAERPVFHLAPADLRRYEHLSEFRRRGDYPRFNL